jgi:methyl-accepting chemotaxis protein
MDKALPKSFVHSFVQKSALLFAGGAVLLVLIVSLTLQEQGTSYAESYGFLAEINRGLVSRSLILFGICMLLSLSGVVVLALVYSHRVAGALHMLGMHTRKVASGDLATSVRLRSTDAIHELAGDFNALSSHYRGLLAQLDAKTQELSSLLDNSANQKLRDGETDVSADITEKIAEIKAILDQIKI